MEKKSIGNYSLIFEPKYSSYQYSVYFTETKDVVVSKIDKYTDVLYGTNKKIKKNTLGDIDRILTVLPSEKEFFDSYIDPSIFKYSGDNLHKIFIGKTKKIYDRKYMECYECVFNLEQMNDKLKYVIGSSIGKIYGNSKKDEKIVLEKNHLISLLTDYNSDFLKFAIDTNFDKKRKFLSSVSSSTLKLASELRRCNKDISEGRVSGTFDEVNALKTKLEEKLTNYKEFRELFLIKQLYLETLKNRKEELIELKSNVLKDEFNNRVYPIYEQISMFPEDNVKIKQKNSGYNN